MCTILDNIFHNILYNYKLFSYWAQDLWEKVCIFVVLDIIETFLYFRIRIKWCAQMCKKITLDFDRMIACIQYNWLGYNNFTQNIWFHLLFMDRKTNNCFNFIFDISSKTKKIIAEIIERSWGQEFQTLINVYRMVCLCYYNVIDVYSIYKWRYI